MLTSALALLLLLPFLSVISLGHISDHDEQDYVPLFWQREIADPFFAGINTFAYLPHVECLGSAGLNETFDIAFIGIPFDTGTSYRPGARFGPSGIRAGSRRTPLCGGYNVPLDENPFRSKLKLLDCGDIRVTPYDNAFALKQMEDGYKDLLHRTPFTSHLRDSATGLSFTPLSVDGKQHPRIITMGGDHTIVLPILRAIYTAYGPISVIHFDSHLDTWKPYLLGSPTKQAAVNHGTYFWWAAKEGLIRNGSSIHGALRSTLSGFSDYEDDDSIGFQRIEAREIDSIGTDGIIKKIRSTVGSFPVYLSIDIDTIDPAFAPATGTPETGGWSTREFRTILRGLDGLNIVSADLVEVAPAYDTNAELTTIAAADILFEILTMMTKNPLRMPESSVQLFTQN